MGWNICCIFINSREAGYLGTFPTHDAVAARKMLTALDYRWGSQSRFSTFDCGISPPRGWFCVGAYDGAWLISGHGDLYRFGYEPDRPLLKACLEAFPTSSVLALELAAAVNYFAYRLYVSGELECAFAGDAERGLVVDIGDIQPEEEPFFNESTVLDGKRVFRVQQDGSIWEYSIPQVGDTLAFSISKRFLGSSLDKFAADQLTVELLKKPRPQGIGPLLASILSHH